MHVVRRTIHAHSDASTPQHIDIGAPVAGLVIIGDDANADVALVSTHDRVSESVIGQSENAHVESSTGLVDQRHESCNAIVFATETSIGNEFGNFLVMKKSQLNDLLEPVYDLPIVRCVHALLGDFEG